MDKPTVTQLRAVQIAEDAQQCPLWAEMQAHEHHRATGIWPAVGEDDGVIYTVFLRIEEKDPEEVTTVKFIAILDSILPEWRETTDIIYVCFR